MVLSAGVWLFILPLSFAVELQTSEVFIKKIDPSLFDWTFSSSSKGFRYRVTLANKPDLPPWLSYIYSDRHRTGFIFGVPPPGQISFNVDVIGINKDTYETSHKVVHLNITEKRDLAKFEVHLKVDNLNVEDMFDRHRLDKLLNIFTHILWKPSKDYLYVTFIESAVKLGARVPLRPQEGEGNTRVMHELRRRGKIEIPLQVLKLSLVVRPRRTLCLPVPEETSSLKNLYLVVVHLGSQEEFSEELLNLQEEIRPLYKFSNCPRDLKRTSVDWHFRSQGFLLDWCKFRLVKLDSESGNAHYKEAEADLLGSSGWELPDRYRLPTRDYTSEILLTLVVPVSTLVVLWIFLSFILCFQHKSLDDPISEDFFESVFEMCEEYTRYFE